MSKKILPSIAQIRAITDQYDSCSLECDGMSNVVHYFLVEAEIDHTVCSGYVLEDDSSESIGWHVWIQLDTQEGPTIIDYRARMWLGEQESVPHGVFIEASFPHIHYCGGPIEPPLLPAHVIQFLIARPEREHKKP